MIPPEIFPWHEPIWRQVAASRQAGRMPHALLIAGPRGVGKRAFAHRLAADLLCEAGKPQACGQCRSCLQFSSDSHPNFFWLRPEEDKRDISVDAVRELSERLALTSHYGGAKVALIEPADALNQNGINALLKTIEEPAAGSYLMLLSEQQMMLAATLRSRCQILRFGVPPSEQALTWLRTQKPAADESALRLAHGAPLRALELMETDAQAQQGEWSKRLLAVAAGQESPIALAVGMDKEGARAFLDWLISWTVDQIKRRLGVVATGKSASSAVDLDLSSLDQIQQICTQALRQLQGNGAVQLTLESVMISFWQLCRLPAQE